MLFLLLAIFSSSLVSIVMRLSEEKAKHNFGLLVMNYCMCAVLSAGSVGISGIAAVEEPGWVKTTLMGCFNGVLYLSAFVLLNINIRKNGVVLSSTFMKLGLLVTMLISVLVYGERPGALQWLGFVLAVAAIILINYRKEAAGSGFRAGLLLLLLCGGMAEAMSKIFEASGVPGREGQFLFFTFLTALILCVGCMVVNGQRIGKAEVLYGLLIGIPNFVSSKFLLLALEDIPAVIAYPLSSVGSILVVTLAGVLVFRERLVKSQWLALGMILAALVLLNM